ncbi:tubulin-folding cofactor E isoform X2 [Macadamia integrifolia]|uniref:tubulin-folding cofactor E isoform X2 n=1 Tax=Macadamia integrifolia TaxID=60698 RepID=UPI001C4FC900|nr:tubulin-folding cofactor E isoform X2 [Macadamia integrifolia]
MQDSSDKAFVSEESAAFEEKIGFKINQRVHSVGDSRRIGTVKYVGPVEGYSGIWVGVDWDNGEGKHDGSINGVRYFQAKCEKSASFVRPQNLSAGITLLEGLELRYRGDSTEEEENQMYVLSARNRRVAIELVGKNKVQDKLSRFEELVGASLSYLGVSSTVPPDQMNAVVPNLKELDLTGNLLSDWQDVGVICEGLPALEALNLTNNDMMKQISGLPLLKSIRILVLSSCGITWAQVELLKQSLPAVEELHLMGNNLREIMPSSSNFVGGFDSLRLLNLEDNCIATWDEILKLSQLRNLEQLHLNKNNLNHVFYPDYDPWLDLHNGEEMMKNHYKPFENIRCLLLGGNKIEDQASVDSLNSFPNLMDIRLSENPIADPGRGGLPRFILIARLAKVEILNGSEVSPRERKESEIRYVRFVMTKMQGNPEEIKKLHPRFVELKERHGIDDEKQSVGAAGPQKMGAGLLSLTLKCVGASIGEKPLLTKKLPATTTVGKLKVLCESFFNLKSFRLKLFLQEEGSPMPLLLDDEMNSLIELGAGNEAIILIDIDD